MTKSELINFLKTYGTKREKYLEAKSHVNRMRREIEELSVPPTLKPIPDKSDIIPASIAAMLYVYPFLIGLRLIVAVISLLRRLNFYREPRRDFCQHFADSLGDTLPIAVNHPFWFWLLFLLLIAILLSVILGVLCVRSDKKRVPIANQNAEADYQERLIKANNMQKQLSDLLMDFSLAEREYKRCIQTGIVPKAYDYCTEELCRYLQDGRADTLKEAINLREISQAQFEFELEMKHHNRRQEELERERINAISDLQYEIGRSADAAERAAEAAEDAAFWSFLDTLSK